MKTYKDLDKSIVMNAPEGAMWVHAVSNDLYYKITPQGRLLTYDMDLSDDWSTSVYAFGKIFNNLLPLPNIEIPWEATEDSECPVEDGTIVAVTLNDGDYVTSYKIIDEEYLPKEDTPKVDLPEKDSKECITEESPKTFTCTTPNTTTYTAPHSVTITLPTPTEIRQDQLIKRLEFLQILANKFPEIHGKVVKLMEVELDAWWHEEVEREESGE